MQDRISITMLDDGIADVRLIRTDKMNALDGAMWEALAAAVGDLDSARWTVERHLTLFEDRLDPAVARRFHRAIEQADLQA